MSRQILSVLTVLLSISLVRGSDCDPTKTNCGKKQVLCDPETKICENEDSLLNDSGPLPPDLDYNEDISATLDDVEKTADVMSIFEDKNRDFTGVKPEIDSIQSEIDEKHEQIDLLGEKQESQIRKIQKEKKKIDSMPELEDDDGLDGTPDEAKLSREIKQKWKKLQKMKQSLDEIQTEIESEQQEIIALKEEKEEIKEKLKDMDGGKVEDPPGPVDALDEDPQEPLRRKKGDLSQEELPDALADLDQTMEESSITNNNEANEVVEVIREEVQETNSPDEVLQQVKEETEAEKLSNFDLDAIEEDLKEDDELSKKEKKVAIEVVQELEPQDISSKNYEETKQELEEAMIDQGQEDYSTKNDEGTKQELEEAVMEQDQEDYSSKNDEETKQELEEAIVEQVQEDKSSEEASETIKEESKPEELAEVDLESVDRNIKKDDDLSVDEKEMASEVIEDLESEQNKSPDDEISEQIGKKRRKLQRLRNNLEIMKEEQKKCEDHALEVREIEAEIERQQKEIHSLSKARNKLSNGDEEEPAKDEEKSESTVSEEIGEVRQELIGLRDELKEEKEEGDDQSVKEIQSEIEAKQKMVHSLTKERDEMKGEQNEENDEGETLGEPRSEISSSSEPEVEVNDDETMQAAEKAAAEDADMVVIDSIGQTKAFDVTKDEDGDGQLIIEEKSTSDLDGEKETVVVKKDKSSDIVFNDETDEGVSGENKFEAAETAAEDVPDFVIQKSDDEVQDDVMSSDEIDEQDVMDKEMGKVDEDEPSISEEAGQEEILSQETLPEFEKVLQDDEIKDDYGMTIDYANTPQDIDAYPRDTNIKGQPSDYDSLNGNSIQVLDNEQPPPLDGLPPSMTVNSEQELNGKEEAYGSTIVGQEEVDLNQQPDTGPPEIIIDAPMSDAAVEDLPPEVEQPTVIENVIESQRLPEQMPISPPASTPSETIGQGAKGLSTHQSNAIPQGHFGPKSWTQRRYPRRWFDYVEDDYGDDYDDYDWVPRRHRRWRRGGSRHRWGRRYPGYYMNDRAPRSSRYKYYSEDEDRKYLKMIQDHFSDDDEIEREELFENKKRSGYPRKDRIVNGRSRSKIQMSVQTEKFDPEMPWAFDAEDTLGGWAADPIVKKNILKEEILGKWAEEPEDYLTSEQSDSWAKEPNVENPLVTQGLGSWAEDPSQNKDVGETILGEKMSPVDELPTQDSVGTSALDEDSVDLIGGGEKMGDYFFEVENKRGRVLDNEKRKEHIALDKEMEKTWKSWAELLTIKSLLHKKGKQDPAINTMVKDEGEKFEELLKMHASFFGNPHPMLVE